MYHDHIFILFYFSLHFILKRQYFGYVGLNKTYYYKLKKIKWPVIVLAYFLYFFSPSLPSPSFLLIFLSFSLCKGEHVLRSFDNFLPLV